MTQPPSPAAASAHGRPLAPLRRYLAAVIVLATLPLAGLVSAQLLLEVRAEQARIEDDLGRSAATLSKEVERELNASIEALTAMAQADALQRGRAAPLDSILHAPPHTRRDWHSLFLLDVDGALVFDTRADRQRGAAPEMLELHQRVVAGAQPAVVHAPDGQQPTVMLAVPVFSGGAVRSVLGARVDATVWQRLAGTTSRPQGGQALLYDAQHRLVGSTLAEPPPAGAPLAADTVAAQRGRPFGVQRTVGVDGRTVYAAWHSVPAAGWSVQLAVPAAPIDAAHRQAILTALGATLGSLLLGVVLASIAARRITRPLQQLAQHGHAGPRERIPVREIAMLRDALRQAAQQDEAARALLAATAQEFQTLFDSSPVGMAVAQDTRCRRVLHNAAMDRLIGPSGASDRAGAHFRRGGTLLPAHELPLHRAAGHGETVLAEEIEVLVPGRAPLFVIATAVPLRDGQGRPRGAISALVDISERKRVEAELLAAHHQLRENQRLMELAQEAGHVGFLHYQVQDDEMRWTPGHCKLLGIDTLQGTGIEAWFERMAGADRQRVEREFWTACALRRESATLEYCVHRSDGNRWLSSRLLLRPGLDGAVAQVTGVTVDMTDHREAEKQRVQLTERAVAARQQAEDASRAKDEFLTMLSHELRNPLGAISAAVDVLDTAVPGSRGAAEARAIIARQTRNLAHMMNDLLDVGRVIAGKILLARQPVNLAAVLDRVHRTLQVTREAAGHALQLEVQDAWIDGDAVRIEQVMTNLMTNAIKYTPAGRQIVARVQSGEGTAIFEVADSGMGIPVALLPRIFDLFVQGERTLDRRAGGLGIGLTLVRRLVELHGGTIHAASSDSGSRFRVVLPAIAPPETSADGAALPAPRRRRVLVVDDNADVLTALRAKLELDGHTVSTAADGIEGLDCLLQQQPEVSIVDIGLPGLTGYELARHARAAGYAGRMIALSGYGAQRDVNNALTAGFDAYLVKPVDRVQLRASLSAD